MSECLEKDEYADRRRHTRRSVYRTAELMLRGSPEPPIDCTVLDESEGGVQVELSQALDLPEELMIKFSDMASQLVRRCWAKGTKAGYQYIEIVPAQRRLVDDVPPPPSEASFVAFNDFIHISRPLLNLAGEPADWLYPAELIHRLLADPLKLRASPQRGPLRLPGPGRAQNRLVAEQDFFGPTWISRP